MKKTQFSLIHVRESIFWTILPGIPEKWDQDPGVGPRTWDPGMGPWGGTMGWNIYTHSIYIKRYAFDNLFHITIFVNRVSPSPYNETFMLSTRLHICATVLLLNRIRYILQTKKTLKNKTLQIVPLGKYFFYIFQWGVLYLVKVKLKTACQQLY